MNSPSRVAAALALAVCLLAANGAHAAPAKLYWTEEGGVSVKRSNLDGSQVEPVISTGENIAYLTASPALGKLFYAVGSPIPQLWSADLNGQNRQLLATFDSANYVRGLAFDPVTQSLVWTSFHGYAPGNGKIRAANTNGSSVHDVLSLSDDYPYGMALDSGVGKMFWANTSQNTLEKASLNGSSRQVIASGVVSSTTQIATDPVAQKLYWNDRSTNSIRWSNYDGSQQAAIASITTAFFPFDSGIAVDHASGFLFWSDTRNDVIVRASLDGSNPTNIVTVGLSNPGSMIVVMIPEPTSAVLVVVAVVGCAAARRHG